MEPNGRIKFSMYFEHIGRENCQFEVEYWQFRLCAIVVGRIGFWHSYELVGSVSSNVSPRGVISAEFLEQYTGVPPYLVGFFKAGRKIF
jgi:hypothetical protein